MNKMEAEISLSTIQNLDCAPDNGIASSFCFIQNECSFFPVKPGEDLQPDLINRASRICQITPLFQDICNSEQSLGSSLDRNASHSGHGEDDEVPFLSIEKRRILCDDKRLNWEQLEHIKMSTEKLSVLYNNEQSSPHENESKKDGKTTTLSNETSPFLECSSECASDCRSHGDEKLSGKVADNEMQHLSDYSSYQNEIQSRDRKRKDIDSLLENGPVLCNEQNFDCVSCENQSGNKEDIEILLTRESHDTCDKKKMCTLPSVMANSASAIDLKQESLLLHLNISTTRFISQISLQNLDEFLIHKVIAAFSNSLHRSSNKVIIKGSSTAISARNVRLEMKRSENIFILDGAAKNVTHESQSHEWTAKTITGIEQLLNFATRLGATQATSAVESSGLIVSSAEASLNLLTNTNNILATQQKENVGQNSLRCLFKYKYIGKILNSFKNIKLGLKATEQEKSSRSTISSAPVIFNSVNTSSSKLTDPCNKINNILKQCKADFMENSEVPTVRLDTDTVPINAMKTEEHASRYVQSETDKQEVSNLQMQQTVVKKRSLKPKYRTEQQDIEDPNWTKFKILNEEELQDSILKIWNVKGSDRFNPRKNLSVSNYQQRRGSRSRKRKLEPEQQCNVKRSRNYSSTFMEDIEYEKVNEIFQTSRDRIRKERCKKTDQLIAKHDQSLKQLKAHIRLMSLPENPSVTQALEDMLDKGTRKLSELLIAGCNQLKMYEDRTLKNIGRKHSSDLDKISKCKNEIEEVGSFYQSLGEDYNMMVLNGDEAQDVWETALTLKMYKHVYKT